MTESGGQSPIPPTQRRRQYVLIAAGLSLVIGSPGAAWWVVGDQSSVSLSDDPNYAVRPFDLSIGLERTIGLASLAFVVIGLATLLRAHLRHGAVDPWWSVLTPLAVAGVMLGVGWRVVTAGVYGANIGAGLVVLFGGPVVLGILVATIIRGVVLLVRRRQRSVFTRPRR